jgi:hypothetical protein
MEREKETLAYNISSLCVTVVRLPLAMSRSVPPHALLIAHGSLRRYKTAVAETERKQRQINELRAE